MTSTFSVVFPATGSHAWDITEGWSKAIKEMGLLRQVFRPRGQWNSQEVENDDGLLDYLKSSPQERFLLLGFDWHSQPLHYGEIIELLRLRRNKNIAVIWEDYNIGEGLMDGIAGRMRNAWNRCHSAFSLAITNHEGNINALQVLSKDTLIHYIGFGVDESRFLEASDHKDSKINRVYFSGKINDWSNEKHGGPYELRRKILMHLNQSNVNLISIQGRQSDFEYTKNLTRSTICLNLPSFSLSPTLRNYEALAAKALLVTWKFESSQSLAELKEFPNVCFYDPYDLNGITRICKDLLRIRGDDYYKLTSQGSQHLYRLSHKYRIQQLLQLLQPPKRFPQDTQFKSQERVLVVDMVFLQVARNGIANVWDSIIKSYLNQYTIGSLVLIRRTDTLLSDYGCRIIEADPVDWNRSPEYISCDIDRLLHEHGICDYSFASTYYTFSSKQPSLQIIHDMIPELLGGSEPVWGHKLASLRQSSILICVSRSTRNHLIGFSQDLADKVHVILNGVPTNHLSLIHEQEITSIPGKDQLFSSDFTMITIGGRYGWKGYKNCSVIFKAFRSFLDRIPQSATSKIVCISHSPQPEAEIKELIRDLPVYFTEATDSELACIRKKSHCLLYPSAIEGFGLPILEGIYSGMSVIASDILPHREAAGLFDSKVYFVPPFNQEKFATAMHSCFNQAYSANGAVEGSDLLQCHIRKISERRWSCFASMLADFLHNPNALRAKTALHQNSLWLSTVESTFRHQKRTLPDKIATSWSKSEI